MQLLGESKIMNIIVIGLGSMGKRRIRLIKELTSEYVIVGVDDREDRRNEAAQLYKISCYDSIAKAYESTSEKSNEKDNIIAAFVCTSPLSHSKIITECLELGMHVFTELNLVDDGYENNLKMASDKNLTLFLSSTFLYREEIKYIQKYVNDSKNWNYIYHIGQYLPDWHPWENYNDFFVGNKRTNGCREIMAIELPWIIETFGAINDFQVVSSKMSKLCVDYDDNYIIQFTHENGNKGVLIVDIVSPYAIRRFEAYSEGKYITWSGTPNSLYEIDECQRQSLKEVELFEQVEHIDGYSTFIVENAYKNEITDFFETIQKKSKQIYGFEKDLEILKLIDCIERLY